MKKLMQKAVSVLGSVALVGATISGAVAATYPAPFSDGDYAVVYGSGSLDSAAASTVASGLPALGGTVGDFSYTDSITDDEVELGYAITNGTGADVKTVLLDNHLSSLKDEKFSWDDGNGSDDYDFHEEITVGVMKPLTTLDDERLTGVALSNEEALMYKFVLEDTLDVTAVGDADADSLYLDILGQEYEVEAMTATSVTVVTSEEVSLAIGGTYTTSDGKTVTLTDVFSTSVEVTVDGKSDVITNTGTTKRINGVRVHLSSIGYHQNDPAASKAILKIGQDISKTYASGDEYIGQDEDDPLWVWDISGLGSVNGYIGVKYNAKIDSANDLIAGDSIKYVGEAYVLPNNYAAVSLDGLTDVKYQDIKVSFEESVDLFYANDSSTAAVENVPVLVLEGEEDDTFTVNGTETGKVYVYYDYANDQVELYYHDYNNDFTPTGKMRWVDAYTPTAATVQLATVQIEETNLDFDLTIAAVDGTNGEVLLKVTNDDFNDWQVLQLNISGDYPINTTSNAAATFEKFGLTAEDADAGDVLFNGTDVSTKNYNYMDGYGVILSGDSDVETEADADEVTLSVPEDQVYAEVTVGLGAVAGEGTTGQKTYKDNESGYSTKNVVVVGGSCINTVAASLLGGSYCGDAFTSATGVGPGQFLIETFSYGTGKVATVVAGYEKDDTAKAATYLANEANTVLTTVGTKYRGESGTQSAVVVS